MAYEAYLDKEKKIVLKAKNAAINHISKTFYCKTPFIKPLVNPKNLKSYDNELNHKENNDLDVMKIYGLAKYDVDILSYSSTERLLLWERDEHPKIKMTVDEMKQKLEEILNAKIVEE